MSEALDLTTSDTTSATAEAFVSNRFENARTYADEAYELLVDSIEDIGTRIDESVDVTAGWDPDSIDLPDIPDVDFSDAGDAPDALDAEMASVELTATYDAVEIPVLSIDDAPTFDGGDAPGNTFSFDLEEYTCTLLDELKEKLSTDLEGGSGFSDAVEQALYDRHLRRSQSAQQALYDNAESYSESRGHTLPNGALSSGIAEANIEISRQQIDYSNEVLTKAAELEQKNIEVTKTAIVQLESILVESHDREETLRLEAEKTGVQLVLETYNTALTKFTTLANIWSTEANTAIAYHAGVLKQAEVAASVYGTEISAYSAQVNAAVAEYTGAVNAYKAETEAYSSLVSSIVRIQEVYLKKYEVCGTVEYKRIEYLLKQAEIEIASATSIMGIEVDGLKSKAAVSAQVVSSSLNSVNAAASYGYSGSHSSSYAYDKTKETESGATTSNVHSWDETSA